MMMNDAINSMSQTFCSDDSIWYFLAEFSLSDLLTNSDRRYRSTSALLQNTVCELGISQGCVDHFVSALIEFAGESISHSRHEEQEFPGSIRIFVPKKKVHEANASKTSMPSNIKPDSESSRIPADPCENMFGGWGYFLIERSENRSPGSSILSHYCIDLYFYKEGE